MGDMFEEAGERSGPVLSRRSLHGLVTCQIHSKLTLAGRCSPFYPHLCYENRQWASTKQRREGEMTDGKCFLKRDGETSPILMGQERAAGGQYGVKARRDKDKVCGGGEKGERGGDVGVICTVTV